MSEIKIITVMRVKNEERWLGPCLREASKLSDQILVIDDGSTDRTPEICKSFPKVQYRYYQRDVNEWRDRSELLAWALENNADWILVLDGDEVLEEEAAQIIRQTLSRLDPRDPVYTAFSLHILYMWNDPELYRCEESIYGNFWIKRLFTTWGQDKEKLMIGQTSHGHNLHANGVPVNLRGQVTKLDVCIKHYGYLDANIRQKKYEYYQKHDQESANAGYYDHLTSETGMSLAKWFPRKLNQITAGRFIKPAGYYRFDRPEVANLVPADAIKILDIGCGQGYLGAYLKEQNPKREVIGLEIDPMAAAAALSKLDHVIVGNIENIILDFETGYFDCIIMSDVVEHLYNPWDTLLYIKKYLKPEGCLVFSIPNIRNYYVIDKLINKGNWQYLESGILDRGHLRFFTINDIQEMLYSCNMTVDIIQGVNDPSVPTLSSTIESGKLVLRDLSEVEVKEMQTVQFLIRAKMCMPLNKPQGLVSIVIPTCNQLEFTKMCLDSIDLFTVEDHEIIVVDNGSNEDTIQYLQSRKDIKLIRNSTNKGFAAAVNQGIAAAKGKYICLLNNDTIVSWGWLSHLCHHLDVNADAMAIGPMSNFASGIQTLPVLLKSLHEVAEFAEKNRICNWLKVHYPKTLSGFCLMIKAEAKDIIGGFDVRFWPGNFEDNDYCLRILLAGYKLLVARDVYIHHFGSQTFSGEKFVYRKTMVDNWGKFREKWGLPEDYDIKTIGDLAESFKGHFTKEDLFLPLNQLSEEETQL